MGLGGRVYGVGFGVSGFVYEVWEKGLSSLMKSVSRTRDNMLYAFGMRFERI